MIDTRLRPAVSRLLDPVATHATRVAPLLITLGGAVVGIAAGVFAAYGLYGIALGAWLANRFLDGLDGAVARRRGTASDLGGYVDMVFDTIVYSAIPLGIAASLGSIGAWVSCAVLLATFYVNVTSWSYLAALLEKRGHGAAATGEVTSITMPTGLIEGAETVVLFSVFLAVPAIAPWGFIVMAVGVGCTVVQRLIWAQRHLA